MKRIRQVWRRLANLSNRQVLLILVAVVVVTTAWSALVNPDGYNAAWLADWLQNFSTEMTGAIATFALFEFIIGSRQERERLLRTVCSKVDSEAKRAYEEITAHGWWRDGSLAGANLHHANLQDALLSGANLQGACLIDADLQGADLATINLQAANLASANLQGTFLLNANLRSAYLSGVNLQEAFLVDANLQGAVLENATYDENTTLPDSTKWTPDTGMARFTDPNHPNFWRSDDPNSPAYRGNTPTPA